MLRQTCTTRLRAGLRLPLSPSSALTARTCRRLRLHSRAENGSGEGLGDACLCPWGLTQFTTKWRHFCSWETRGTGPCEQAGPAAPMADDIALPSSEASCPACPTPAFVSAPAWLLPLLPIIDNQEPRCSHLGYRAGKTARRTEVARTRDPQCCPALQNARKSPQHQGLPMTCCVPAPPNVST